VYVNSTILYNLPKLIKLKTSTVNIYECFNTILKNPNINTDNISIFIWKKFVFRTMTVAEIKAICPKHVIDFKNSCVASS